MNCGMVEMLNSMLRDGNEHFVSGQAKHVEHYHNVQNLPVYV